MTHAALSSAPATTVYYDGSCPVCAREIAHYRGCDGADSIVWTDISGSSDALVAADLTRAEADGRFHVRRADGTLADGGAAFASLWLALPKFRRLGRLAATRAGAAVLEVAYRLWLVVMPLVRRVLPPPRQQ
ncbi:thiol-disulfide oxidoreductase DCC family protein [Blastochloris viridis]|uniref:DUF393 domain-containing protein n=1 Tax=Blastochloris viridis TaxID=1079 RepID=A0A0S4Q7U7_BLAVI|nr:DUF393 domain-containing protein [Blastochloris viridis]CUU43629.1 hypothetical protein BVIRIDIS_26540 [Blastochloris viridis]